MREFVWGGIAVIGLYFAFELWVLSIGTQKIEAPIIQEPQLTPGETYDFPTDDGSAVITARVDLVETAGIPLPVVNQHTTNVGTVSLVLDNAGFYQTLRVDEQGYLVFKCSKCPDKMCKELACSFSMMEPGDMRAECTCREDSK